MNWSLQLERAMELQDKQKFIVLDNFMKLRMEADMAIVLIQNKKGNRIAWEQYATQQDEILNKYLLKGE